MTKWILRNVVAFVAVLTAAPVLAAPEVSYATRQGQPSRNERRTLLDPIRLGVTVGTGLPNILSFSALVKVTRYFGAGLNVGLIPKTRVAYYGDATLSFQEYDVFARIHPFGGGLFAGAGLGYATLRGSVAGTFDTSPYADQVPAGVSVPESLVYESRGLVRAMVITPQLGYFHVTKVGFGFGLDVGAQIPIAPSVIEFRSSLVLPANTPEAVRSAVRSELLEPNDAKVRDSLQTVGRTPIPTINFRIGWVL